MVNNSVNNSVINKKQSFCIPVIPVIPVVTSVFYGIIIVGALFGCAGSEDVRPRKTQVVATGAVALSVPVLVASGSVVELTWEKTEAQENKLNLQISKDSGETWVDTVFGFPNTGKFKWTVPNEEATTYRLRLVSGSSGTVKVIAITESDFTIDHKAPLLPLTQTFVTYINTSFSFTLAAAVDITKVVYSFVDLPTAGGTLSGCVSSNSGLICEFVPDAGFWGAVTFSYIGTDEVFHETVFPSQVRVGVRNLSDKFLLTKSLGGGLAIESGKTLTTGKSINYSAKPFVSQGGVLTGGGLILVLDPATVEAR